MSFQLLSSIFAISCREHSTIGSMAQIQASQQFPLLALVVVLSGPPNTQHQFLLIRQADRHVVEPV